MGVFELKIPIIFYEAYKQKNQKKIIKHVLQRIEDPFFEKICKSVWMAYKYKSMFGG